jgi:hypothetical protein
MKPVVSIPLRSRRRSLALAVQKFQHVVPAVPLLAGGLQAIQDPSQRLKFALGLFEIATSGLLLATVVRALRHARAPDPHAAHSAHGIDWFHVFAAGVLFAEAAEHWHLTQHWTRPTLVLALITLGMGLLHGRVEALSDHRRALRVDDAGLYVGGRPFGAFRASWPDVRDIEIGDRYARIRTRDGRERRIDLSDVQDAKAIRAALADAQSRLTPGPA